MPATLPVSLTVNAPATPGGDGQQVTIRSVERGPGPHQIHISWDTAQGGRYTIRGSASLTGEWFDIATVEGDGSTKDFLVEADHLELMFVRVFMQPPD